MVTIKLNLTAIPGYDPGNPTVVPEIAHKLLHVVGPSSSGFEYAYLASNNGFYRKHNMDILTKYGVRTASAIIWASYYDHMWLTDEELVVLMISDCWTSLYMEVSNGIIDVAKDGVSYTAATLLALKSDI